MPMTRPNRRPKKLLQAAALSSCAAVALGGCASRASSPPDPSNAAKWGEPASLEWPPDRVVNPREPATAAATAAIAVTVAGDGDEADPVDEAAAQGPEFVCRVGNTKAPSYTGGDDCVRRDEIVETAEPAATPSDAPGEV